ncbi:unnamed protein product, partial [Tetraodon nigroviridis]
LQRRVGRVGLRRAAVGDLQLRPAALLRLLQPGGDGDGARLAAAQLPRRLPRLALRPDAGVLEPGAGGAALLQGHPCAPAGPGGLVGGRQLRPDVGLQRQHAAEPRSLQPRQLQRLPPAEPQEELALPPAPLPAPAGPGAPAEGPAPRLPARVPAAALLPLPARLLPRAAPHASAPPAAPQSCGSPLRQQPRLPHRGPPLAPPGEQRGAGGRDLAGGGGAQQGPWPAAEPARDATGRGAAGARRRRVSRPPAEPLPAAPQAARAACFPFS